MALDTRNKRASSIFPRLPFRRDWPLADGSIDAEDRAATAYDYGGLQDAGGGGGVATVYPFLHQRVRRHPLTTADTNVKMIEIA